MIKQLLSLDYIIFTALNDSKLIGFCIYNVVIVCVFGVPLTHVLPREQTTLNFVLLTTLVMFCTTMCLCILFIPKVYPLFLVHFLFYSKPILGNSFGNISLNTLFILHKTTAFNNSTQNCNSAEMSLLSSCLSVISSWLEYK